MMRMIEVKGRRVEGGGRYHLCRRGEAEVGRGRGKREGEIDYCLKCERCSNQSLRKEEVEHYY